LRHSSSSLISYPDGTTYRRTGECDGCVDSLPGKCCTYVKLPLARELTPDEVKWLELHPGLSIDGTAVRIEIPCSALKNGRCELFGKPERPTMCERYPELPELDSGCAYTFERIKGRGGSVRPR